MLHEKAMQFSSVPDYLFKAVPPWICWSFFIAG